MGSSMSCVPQHNFRFSSKSFIRRNSSRLFRKKNPQEGQEKSNSIINILCTVTPRKEMSPKDLEAIENIKWDPPFPYDPASGWKKSSINVKNYGRLIHSSKVRFRFLHCQDVHDCYLDLFQTHLHFVSNNTTGLTYQGTLPLKELTICKVHNMTSYGDPQEFAFQINGVSLNPIIVYCSNQEDMDNWFGLLKEHIEINGGTAIIPDTYSRVKVHNTEQSTEGKEELRNSISKEPIYEWEGSQRESLGPITYVTKVRLQHLPCQEQYDRLLVMYPSNLIILSEESDGLFYKGKLPLNMLTVTTPCQDIKPNTFMIEGKLINPIVVSCPNTSEFRDWMQHFKAADVPVLSPPPPVYDIIYTPTQREAPELNVRWSGSNRGGAEEIAMQKLHSERRSCELQLPHRNDNPLSPGYTEPLCYISSRPTSVDTQYSVRLGSRSNSMSSQTRPAPLPLRYSSPQRTSYLSSEEPMSPIYSSPYSAVHHNATAQHVTKAPLIKSNSWSTPQSSIKYQLSIPQRHSDLLTHRKPLSPLYDDPTTPGMYPLEEDLAKVSSHSSQVSMEQHYPPLLPTSFRLCTPPLGRRNRSIQHQEHDESSTQWAMEQRAQSVSRMKLLPDPNTMLQHNHITQREASSLAATHMRELPYSLTPDDHSYLKPVEPDDQEIDYDNIWEFDGSNGMIQALPGISTHRTQPDFSARGLGAMETQTRWS
ncbi:probable pleckstrin homology domain-containing family N member 1 [Ictalurus furcatus]|uniref:probable pleckstrin homology domain-containing family N member 1 n=1 Tax=Ictalurus furcatus TaxID=66913 RepID=UPI0023507034|nr:probable pleckstrin homology domain-containing family N member 1 [Ictalurus furcatus]